MLKMEMLEVRRIVLLKVEGKRKTNYLFNKIAQITVEVHIVWDSSKFSYVILLENLEESSKI